MWPTKEFDESRPVTLILGEDRISVQEETSFLATISPFFRAMFYSGFAESNMDSIELLDCDAIAMQLILEKLHAAKDQNIGIDDTISEIVTPDIFCTLSYLGISSNVEKAVLFAMRFHEIEEYTTLAEESGNEALLKVVELKSLGFFIAYRDSDAFKKKTIVQLVAYLKHPFLEYSGEKEVMKAVLNWLDLDLEQRIVHFEAALSCVNWDKLSYYHSEKVLSHEVLKKNSTLLNFFVGLYEQNCNTNTSRYTCESFPAPESELGFYVSKVLLEESRKRKYEDYFISVPFAYNLETSEKLRYGVCIYDNKSNVFLDQVFLLPNDENDTLGYVKVEFFDFHIYSFMRPCRTDNLEMGFNIEKQTTLLSYKHQWKDLGSYGCRDENVLILSDNIHKKKIKITQQFGNGKNDPFLWLRDEQMLPNVIKKRNQVSLTIATTDKFNLLTETFERSEIKVEPKRNIRNVESIYVGHQRPICCGGLGSSEYRLDDDDLKAMGIPNSLLAKYRDSEDLISKREDLEGNDLKSSHSRHYMIDEILHSFETWKSIEEKLQAQVAPIVGKNILDFKASYYYIQRVNPLWFTKFP